MSIVKPGIMYDYAYYYCSPWYPRCIGKNVWDHFLSLSLITWSAGKEKKEKNKNNIKEMIGYKERSMLVLSELQLNKRVGNVQSIFSIRQSNLGTIWQR